MMPKKRQALVEYEDMNGSCNAVTYAAENQVYIAGHPAFINYSTSQKISRPGDSDDTRSVNNVLLLTIINPIYPITTVMCMCDRVALWFVTALYYKFRQNHSIDSHTLFSEFIVRFEVWLTRAFVRCCFLVATGHAYSCMWQLYWLVPVLVLYRISYHFTLKSLNYPQLSNNGGPCRCFYF